ncbi:MAG: DnaJ domain-containing protein, partial [bacterium]
RSIPVVCEGVEIMNLDIGPEEGFLISRIDGRTDLESLAYTSGMGRDKTMGIIRDLQEKNVIVFRGGEEKEKPAPDAADVEVSEDLYDLAELKKVLKKPLPQGEEFKRIVESIFVNLENLSYYELLNVDRGARPEKIKKAYLKGTKLFHPDRYYRNADKEFKGKLQEIFKQLNKGYRELLDPDVRREYDLKLETEEEEEIMVAPVSPTSRTRGVKGSEASRQRADKQAKLGITTTRLTRKSGISEGTKLKLDLKGKKSSSPIKKQVEKMKQEGGRASDEQGRKFYNWALQERDRGNLKGAKTNLELALQYEPGNSKYKKLKEELEKKEDSHKAEVEFKAGQDSQAAGHLSEALRYYKEALNLGYESPKLHYRMAELSMELDANYERARSLALKAVEMEAGVPEYHLCLARAYKGLGQKQPAIVQLNKVLKLDPKNKIASKELKSLKRG